MSPIPRLKNYINGTWRDPDAVDSCRVTNPATAEVLAEAPFSAAADVEAAASAARIALESWRRVPAGERVQHLFKLKDLLEGEFEDLSRTVTIENGKTLGEARGEIRRAIENVEVACGIPSLMQGDVSEDIAPGIDELMLRQPLGVCATICPFNFPGMIPFWFLPYSLACGNTHIIKPSERTPLTMEKIIHLVERAGFPAGVVNMVHGSADTVRAILEHPEIAGITFVGSTEVARYIYGHAAAHGKRVQAQGGAKNPLVILPDADLETTTRIVADSAFGNAGQRCLAASLAITVGEARGPFTEALSRVAAERVVGYGLDENVEMGPVISPQSKARIEGLIQTGVDEGARAIVDGRNASVRGFEQGNFLRPTVIDDVRSGTEIARTEIFGPVLGLMHTETIEEAIDLVNANNYGNMACLFTGNGAAARKFRYEVAAGNIGINIGVAAPMAYFPFSGWKDSFFGTLHGQGKHAVEFFTQTKVVVERWPKEWSRRF
jgi:malonate-semialdehyde dehydrogenase (acetylating)/methylmalonate-semialdehyde dehydrogenase